MSNNSSEQVMNLIEAYKHPIRADILLYLRIHKRISLTDLAKLIGKSKPTISRHIKILEKKNLVTVIATRSENTPGNINPHYYELTKNVSHAVKGEDILVALQENPSKTQEIVENMMDARMSYYRFLHRVSELTIDYLEKMKEATLENIDSQKEVKKILHDHTGHISLDFLNKETVYEIVELNTDEFDSIVKKHRNDQSDINPYVFIKVLLPLKRIMDMEQENIWKSDGTIWPVTDDL